MHTYILFPFKAKISITGKRRNYYIPSEYNNLNTGLFPKKFRMNTPKCREQYKLICKYYEVKFIKFFSHLMSLLYYFTREKLSKKCIKFSRMQYLGQINVSRMNIYMEDVNIYTY